MTHSVSEPVSLQPKSSSLASTSDLLLQAVPEHEPDSLPAIMQEEPLSSEEFCNTKIKTNAAADDLNSSMSSSRTTVASMSHTLEPCSKLDTTLTESTFEHEIYLDDEEAEEVNLDDQEDLLEDAMKSTQGKNLYSLSKMYSTQSLRARMLVYTPGELAVLQTQLKLCSPTKTCWPFSSQLTGLPVYPGHISVARLSSLPPQKLVDGT